MWQAIKKFRQAYLDAKGNRLHAEAEASRNALCQSAMSVDEAGKAFNHSKTWTEAFFEAHEECTRYEEEQEYYKH